MNCCRPAESGKQSSGERQERYRTETLKAGRLSKNRVQEIEARIPGRSFHGTNKDCGTSLQQCVGRERCIVQTEEDSAM